MATWLTVDTDDVRHLPKHQGHPTRALYPLKDKPTSSLKILNWVGKGSSVGWGTTTVLSPSL